MPDIDNEMNHPLEEDDSLELSVDDIEVEVEDDTPEEDRGRTPMPRPLLEELEADGLEDYDDKVKERLKQMRKAWHDERRAKEEAAREQSAAVEYARQVREENQRLRSTLDKGGTEYVAMMRETAQMRLQKANNDYREAYESGDTERIVETQNAVHEAQMLVWQAQQYRLPTLHGQQPVVQQQHVQAPPAQAPAALDPLLEDWIQRNPWYGEDDEMTSTALGLHQKLLREGEVAVGSKEYYAVLDDTMRRRFPEHFGSEQGPSSRTRAGTVVAPATRSTSPNRIRLSRSQVALAKKLGITPEQYALEMKKMNDRETRNV